MNLDRDRDAILAAAGRRGLNRITHFGEPLKSDHFIGQFLDLEQFVDPLSEDLVPVIKEETFEGQITDLNPVLGIYRPRKPGTFFN